MDKITKQEYIEKCKIPELDQIDDSVFENIIKRFESTNNKDQLRMLECVFHELKSHSKYSQIALKVSKEFEDRVEEYRVKPIAKVGDLKEFGEASYEGEIYERESEIPKITVGYDKIGNYAYTLAEMCEFRVEEQIDTVYDSVEYEIHNDVTRSISKYEKIKKDFSESGKEFLSQKNSIIEDAKQLIIEIENENYEYYRKLPELTGMSRSEIDARYDKLMRRQPRLLNRVKKDIEQQDTVKQSEDKADYKSIEEEIEFREDDRELLKKALEEIKDNHETFKKASIYDKEDFIEEPQEDDRELLKKALKEFEQKTSDNGGFIATLSDQVVSNDIEYQENISKVAKEHSSQEKEKTI